MWADIKLADTLSARFSSRTAPKPENGLRFFEDFKGIWEGD
jgi:hypothetical protein